MEPRIILFDLEIIPNLPKALEYWPQLNCSWDSSTTLKAEITSICSFGYEVFGDNRASIKNAWDFKGWKKNVNDDKELCVFIYEQLKDADAFVYQNGDRFDLKHLNTRLAINGIGPLPKVPTIDTKKLLKKHYFLLRNSLSHAAKILTDERKLDHGEGWELWVDTWNRVPKAMNLMSKYCKQDIVTLRALFKQLRPFITNIPNYNLFSPSYASGRVLCPLCGSTRLKKNGLRYNKTNYRQRMMCLDCGGSSVTGAKSNVPRSM